MYWAYFVDIQLAPFSSTQDSRGAVASEGLGQVFLLQVNLQVRKTSN